MKPKVGVVSTVGRDRLTGRPTSGVDAYLVAEGERVAWLEQGQERVERARGAGVLLAVAHGEGPAEDAGVAASSVCRVLSRLWAGGPPEDPAGALADFLASAHTRMHWKTRERGARLAASCAVAWLVGDRVAWAELGTARVLLQRDGALTRLSAPWPEGELQRFLGGSRGLGDDTAVHLRPGRNVGTLPLRPVDQVLVTTAGLWGGLDARSAGHVLQHVAEPQVAAVTLMDRALAQGATQAVTVALLDARSGPAASAAPPVAEPPPRLRRDVPPIRRGRRVPTEP